VPRLVDGPEPSRCGLVGAHAPGQVHAHDGCNATSQDMWRVARRTSTLATYFLHGRHGSRGLKPLPCEKALVLRRRGKTNRTEAAWARFPAGAAPTAVVLGVWVWCFGSLARAFCHTCACFGPHLICVEAGMKTCTGLLRARRPPGIEPRLPGCDLSSCSAHK
jgi:hypothetical protein